MPSAAAPAPRPSAARRRRHRSDAPFAFERTVRDTPRLRGSAQILGHLRVRYDTPAGGLPPGTLVSLLLDRHSSLLGVARLCPADATEPDRRGLRDAVHLLLDHQAGDPRAAAGYACLLVSYRTGPARLLDRDRWLWAALKAATRVTGLQPADVLVSTSPGWFTMRAGTAGEPEAALREPSSWSWLPDGSSGDQNGIVTNGEE